MISNNKISSLVSTQVPFFVRNDHPTFVAFLEAYYEWLEQSNNTVNIAKSMREQLDVDKADRFLQDFYDSFLPLIPKDVAVDKVLLLKHIKDFYRARGSEKSVKFLMRILYDEDVEFYYPQRDILRASDGKWFVERSIKIDDIQVDSITNNDIDIINQFVGKKITGSISGASALVEKTDTYYDSGFLVKELKLSSQFRDFVSGEKILSTFEENGLTKNLAANLFSGSISKVEILKRGSGYRVGDLITLSSNVEGNARLVISAVSTGNLTTIAVLEGGAGFQNANPVLISGGGGAGATATIQSVVPNGFYHPNTYNIAHSTIALEANTQIGNNRYSNLNSSNANTHIANAMSYFLYANTGPMSTVLLLSAGAGYSTNPTISAQANNRVRSLSILGKMIIIDGGQGYRVNDSISFVNNWGSYGYGAAGRVRAVNVAASNAISEVEFVAVPGHIIGGAGYDYLNLPTVNVTSTNANAFGANIVMSALLGTGESLVPVGSEAGAIEAISIVSRGAGYTDAPTINLQNLGDGTAQAVATIITGTFTYPGRYINDDGHLSSYNFIQDRDYYQKFSYVLKLKKSINQYRQALKTLIHPAGMKLFGEYLSIDDGSTANVSIRSTSERVLRTKTVSYSYSNAHTSNITIGFASHGVIANDIVYLDWWTGNVATSNTVRGPYRVRAVVNVNSFVVVNNVYTANVATSGNVNVSIKLI